MSVAGVAIATVLAQAMSEVPVMRRLRVADYIYRVTLKKIRFDMDNLKHIVMIGFPQAFSQHCIRFQILYFSQR